MPHLLDLPPETLDECLGYLLPPLAADPNTLTNALWFQPEPRVLCRILSVCKVLNRLASPWIWRRVKLDISNELAPGHLHRFQRLKSLCDHPELAAHTRVLFVDCNFLDGWDYNGNFNLHMLFPALRLMNNIRVVHFEYDVFRDHLAVVDKVFTEIVSKPHLHTLTSTYFPWRTPKSNSLARLNCVDLDMPRLLEAIKAAPNLESLAMTYGEVDVRIMEFIPWTTLRQLGFWKTRNWACFLDGFAVSHL